MKQVVQGLSKDQYNVYFFGNYISASQTRLLQVMERFTNGKYVQIYSYYTMKKLVLGGLAANQ